MKFHLDLHSAIKFSPKKNLVDELLNLRQFKDPEMFLNPSLQMIRHDIQLPSQYQINDMKKGTDLIRYAIAHDWKIVIYSDYDTDGITSNTIMYSLLKQLGAKHVLPYCPSRIHDGYGLNMKESRKIIAQGVKLVITTDNGITCVPEVKLLRQNHVNVIISDHHDWQVTKGIEVPKIDRKVINHLKHDDDIKWIVTKNVLKKNKTNKSKLKALHKLHIQIKTPTTMNAEFKLIHSQPLKDLNGYALDVLAKDTIPNANAIIMANCPYHPFHFTGFCGAGIAFMIACYMLHRVAKEYLDIACLGTVADSVPLLQEDRIIVKYGLEEIHHSRRPGIIALANVAGVKLNTLEATDLSFNLIPRLNTLGRVETKTSNANVGRKLLLAKK